MSLFRKKKDEADGLSEAEEVQLIQLLRKAGIDILSTTIRNANVPSTTGNLATPGSRNKVPPGYFYDPKTGKTFRQARPRKRSEVYLTAEQLVKDSIKSLTDYYTGNKLVHKNKDGKHTVTKEDGSPPSKEQLEEVAKRQAALENAKIQFKCVRDLEEAKRPHKGAVKAKRLDPSKLPTLTVGKDGKVSWADVVVNKPPS